MRYWLMKSEPDVFSIDDLARKGREAWDGVRNYQARNYMRDGMRLGDRILFYHSRVEPIGIAGEAEVVSAAYPDPSQFNPESKYFDPGSKPENPRWMLVEVGFVCKYPRLIELAELKRTPGLEQMVVVKKGSRLSVQPVESGEYERIRALVGVNS